MKSIKIVTSLVLVFFIMACESSLSKESSADLSHPELPALYEEQALGEATEPATQRIDKKLIKNGRVEFESDDLDKSKRQILAAVTKFKAYVSSDQGFKSETRLTNSLSIRVPSANFDSFLSEATKGVRKFDYKTIEVKDVTEEFVDIHARLKTKKELEKRYLELLKKAGSIKEMLAVEEQIGMLRADIESIEGRLKYLESRVAYSEVSISFYQQLASETAYGRKFKNGFKNGWDNLIVFFIILTNLWPFILFTVLLLLGIRYWRKKKLKK